MISVAVMKLASSLSRKATGAAHLFNLTEPVKHVELAPDRSPLGPVEARRLVDLAGPYPAGTDRVDANVVGARSIAMQRVNWLTLLR